MFLFKFIYMLHVKSHCLYTKTLFVVNIDNVRNKPVPSVMLNIILFLMLYKVTGTTPGRASTSLVQILKVWDLTQIFVKLGMLKAI